MGRRIEGIPVFAQRPDEVSAIHYNLWRRARIRFGAPIHVPLKALKEMELILEHDAWVVVDHNRGEIPVLAWTDFRPSRDRGLHEPVPCVLNYYHFMASGLRGKVLERMADALEQRLRGSNRR